MSWRATIGSALTAGLLLGCFRHSELPVEPPRGCMAGRAPAGFDPKRACGHWADAVGPGGEDALVHDSFPELFAGSCYVPVHYDGEVARPDPTPAGCGYPLPGARERLMAELARYEAIATGHGERPLPPELACDLPPKGRAAAARQNARAVARVLADLDEHKVYPYAAVSAFGFGHADQAESVLADYSPGDACRSMSKDDLDLLTINVTRAGRAAMAQLGRVAPVIIVSGGAVHSRLIEAFALDHLAVCKFGAPADRVLLDPCADHTHTNVKHTASLVVALGGRAAYIVTDDGLQSDYLEEWNFFNLIGGSIDQRALRDWGYLLGSWRRASVGIKAGFWFSPYRFWAEPAKGLGSFQCARRSMD
jgi:hypothetical protein